MVQPLDFLTADPLPKAISLGAAFADRLQHSHISSLLDCLPDSNAPAIFAPDSARPPLTHAALRNFVRDFRLPSEGTSLGPNDRVMTVLPAGPESAVALLALGAYHSCAPVNSSCTVAELMEDAARLRIRALVTTPNIADRLGLADALATIDCALVYLFPHTGGPAGLFDLASPQEVSQVVRPTSSSKLQRLDDTALILHTSGTSGKKKVVRYPLRTLLVGTWCVVHSWGLCSNDINLNMMPLFHVGGIVRNLLAPVLSGGSAIMCLGFDPVAFWSLAQDLKPTWYYAAPTVHHAVLSTQPDGLVPSRDLALRFIANAGACLLPSLAASLKNVFGAVILPSYGMTECMPIATPPTDYVLDRPGCTGIACGPDLSIRDPANLDRAFIPGKTGAVCVRGLPCFVGYEISPDPAVPLDTSVFSSDGWFNSGDMGYMDDDGYLYITGRSKEIINKGGEVISPFEIEEAVAIASKGCFKTVLAFSIDHDVLQETIGLVVVVHNAEPRLSLAQLHDRLRGHLHPSKWPFALVYMEDVPKNSAGKPLRIALAKRLGLGQVSDSHSHLRRHFEAELPPNTHALSEAIPCLPVSVDVAVVAEELRRMPEVDEATVRICPDESTAAYVALAPKSPVRAEALIDRLARALHGYEIPDHVYTVDGALVRGVEDEEYDYEVMERAALGSAEADMTPAQCLVRDIVADLLGLQPAIVHAHSDFFLLGGTSLLLGKLAYLIRKQAGVGVGVTELFSQSTVSAIAALVSAEQDKKGMEMRPELGTRSSSVTCLADDYDYDQDLEYGVHRSADKQTRTGVLFVQAIPFLFFYSFKMTVAWSILIYLLSTFAGFLSQSFWEQMWALIRAIVISRVATRTLSPILAILFKWVVIGKHRPGVYKMWSGYYLRCWIVNQSLRMAGRGIFNLHPSLVILYYRLLGARIGKDVYIDDRTRLYEPDLITLQDGCRIDTATLRAFAVERNGQFVLAPITVGSRAFVNTYTFIAPGTRVPDGVVYGPHASSFDEPAPKSYAAYNRTLKRQPALLLRLLFAWPLIVAVVAIAHIPWVISIYAMVSNTTIQQAGLNSLESVIVWFGSLDRVLFHALARLARDVGRPLIQLVLGIAIKRLLGLNTEGPVAGRSELVLLRKYINGVLLSQGALKQAFSILGTHYENVSIVYRAMGAKIGRRVYWPGTGVFCPDPELLDIGDDVVFGSRSALITSDRIGSGKIVVENGAMIADRVVLLPNTRVGSRAVMGSGALGKRGATYADGSTWIGNENGEAVCFNPGTTKEGTDVDADTITPFGRAFYKRQASFFVLPYPVVAFISFLVACTTAVYWSLGGVVAAQVLRHIHLRPHHFRFVDFAWARQPALWLLIYACFIGVLAFQGTLALAWVIVAKWLIIGRRQAGRYDWDQSSYCQRWQLHLTLARVASQGFSDSGVLGPLTGSAYIVWYFRALGATIGDNCAVWAGGKLGLMTEPDLVELGDNVNLDDCSVVSHLNSRGNFSLNCLKIGNDCAMRSGSRLLSGASMEDASMLCEHTLLTSGDVADSDTVYVGWPAKPLSEVTGEKAASETSSLTMVTVTCPLCSRVPQDGTMISKCGHLFCNTCISHSLSSRKWCPVCFEPTTRRQLKKVQMSFGPGTPPSWIPT